MGRPEYLNCPMTPGVIRGIKERQEAYDADPEKHERREQERQDMIQQEEMEERAYLRDEEDRSQAILGHDDLPF
jgi:hypothetical protein